MSAEFDRGRDQPSIPRRLPWPVPRQDAVGEELAAAALAWGLARFASYAETLDGVLGESLEEAALAIRERAPDPAALFLGTRGTPAFVMLAWVAESLEDAPMEREVVGAAAEAMLCAYLAVRLQDDRIDRGSNPYWTFLEHALMARTGRLLAEVSGDPLPTLAQWERQVVAFSEVAAWDAAMRIDANTDWERPGAVARQGDKFLPMAGPLTALLWRAGRSDLLPPLLETIRRLGMGLQLANDLFNAQDDLHAGFHTPYLQLLGLEPGLDGPRELAQAIVRSMGDGSMRLYVARVTLAYRSALGPASELGGGRMAAHLVERGPAFEQAAMAHVALAMGMLMRRGERP